MADQLASQSGILRIDIANKADLLAAYMPFISNGGIFVSQQILGSARYDMGSDVFLLMHLVEQNERIPVAGKVVWITPSGGGMQRPPGIGVQFAAQDKGASHQRIETILAGMIESQRATHTL